jgi:hypothetical protein
VLAAFVVLLDRAVLGVPLVDLPRLGILPALAETAATLEGVAAGLAWAAGQWPRRFEVAAPLEDPSRTEELARDRWFD